MVKIRIPKQGGRPGIPQSRRQEVFESNDYCCIYCFSKATQIDHVIPWAISKDDSRDNLVPSCNICNCVAGNKIFGSFKEKTNHIRQIRLKAIKQPVAIWSLRELSMLGETLKEIITGSSIIVEDEKEAKAIGRRLNREGLSYVIYKGKVVHSTKKYEWRK